MSEESQEEGEEMITSIYFEIEEDKKKKFNIALAHTGHTKTEVLNSYIDEYIKKYCPKTKTI